MKGIETSKIEEFAEILVERAEIAEGDNVYLLSPSLEALPLFEEVRRQIFRRGAHPHEHLLYDSQIGSSGIDYDMMKHSSLKNLENLSEAKLEEVKRMDAYIRIGGESNSRDLTGLSSEKISARKKATRELLEERMKTNWVVTRYPTTGLAQDAEMPTKEFEEFVVEAVTGIDYDEQYKKNEKIKEKFDEADEVRIVSEDTDIELSLEGREGENDHGDHNIPCGEVFYAPKKRSLNGHIKFTFPGVSNGNWVKGIYLEFEDGKIVDYSSESNEEFLKDMIETDEGSKFIGELGIGTNKMIDRFTGNTLFDEKIGGSIHMAIGNAYEKTVPEGGERNESGIHWDIVKDLRKDKGDGGKIILDGDVVQKDGEWQF